jgi:transposase
MGGADSSKPKRRFRSKQERRAIVEETLKPGTSVSVIARAFDVNANQVFGWRKLYREGRLEVAENSTALIPVKITQTLEKLRQSNSLRLPRAGIIDIDLGHARVRIEGSADPDCVRAAMEGLVR